MIRRPDWYDIDEPPREIAVRFTGGYRPGELYEFGAEGSDIVFGDYIDPVRYPPELIGPHDVDDGVDAVWVRPCGWTAAHNGGGIMAVGR